MSTRMFFLVSCSLLLGMMVVGEATAQVTEYAAKYTCGRVQPGAAGGDADAVVGVYATAINIHNSQADTQVPLVEKIFVVNPEGQGPGRVFERRDTLGPDKAERVDCPVIFGLLTITPGTHVEGFVVLEIPPQLFLDVVGVYSARASTGEASSLDVVVYSPKEITR